jgi:hypothetical protein
VADGARGARGIAGNFRLSVYPGPKKREDDAKMKMISSRSSAYIQMTTLGCSVTEEHMTSWAYTALTVVGYDTSLSFTMEIVGTSCLALNMQFPISQYLLDIR